MTNAAIFAAYREWLGALPAICVVTGRPAEDLCHLRHHTGMARKPPPWHSLPLTREVHTRQESLGLMFFQNIGIANPLREAEMLFAIYHAREFIDAAEWVDARLRAIHAMVDQEQVRMFMEGETV